MDFLVSKSNMARKMKIPVWVWALVAIGLVAVVMMRVAPAVMPSCPGSQVYCPGVGCLSGIDKCVPGAKGGPSRSFSQIPSKEQFINKTCPDGTRTDGPCLMDGQEYPSHSK